MICCAEHSGLNGDKTKSQVSLLAAFPHFSLFTKNNSIADFLPIFFTRTRETSNGMVISVISVVRIRFHNLNPWTKGKITNLGTEHGGREP